MTPSFMHRLIGPLLVGAVILVSGCSGSSDPQEDRAVIDSSDTSGTTEPIDGLVLVPDLSVVADDVIRHELSDAQAAEVGTSGYPDRFVLQFESAATDGAPTIRHETWYYDRSGTRLVYSDGAVFSETRDDTPIELDGLDSTPYRPELFTAGMTVEELLAVTGETGYARQRVDPAIAEDGWLIFVTGAVAGFEADRLTFVETIPLTAS